MGDVLSGFEHRLGHQYRCEVCSGQGQLRCSGCSGRGNVRCFSCHGQGRLDCSVCGGTSKRECSRCSGRGSYNESYTHQVWDTAAKMYVSKSDWRWVACPACNGGKVNCNHCDYAGKVQCAGCAGRGVCDCGACNATGRVDCSHCAAMGCRHCLGRLSCKIESQDQLTLLHGDQEAMDLVLANIDVKRLPEYGRRGRASHHRRGERAVDSTYPVSVEVTRAHMAAAERSFAIHAFGKQHEIFDFKNIVGHLLAKDLHGLQTCVQPGHRDAAGLTRLVDRANAFLESEINLQIAESVLASKSAEQAIAQVRSRHQGLVDERYVAQASAALQQTLEKLFGARMLKPGMYWVGLLTMATCALTLSHGSGGWYNVAVSVLGAGPVWAGMEWQARRRVGADFDSLALGARMKTLIDKSGLAWRMRGAAFLIACAFAGAAFWATQYLGSRYKAHFGGPEGVAARSEAPQQHRVVRQPREAASSA
ncbi:hypothetical protein QTI33_23390 [Variovorax sp. J22P271]|uniref:hypothetical protein n=1 Tax=Variovorax davisae TaxID=3053515 RepID=UPI0025761235|nr:hypothetical protein [Variovorax sp. J22P271]MDM0035098.1 hypothetical protein [Variovorax sp. J22P271]